MSADRWRAAGLADPRAEWFSEVSRWSTEATIPVDFVKCLSADEMRTRLIVGETYSALLVGAGAAGADRSLIAEARDHGAAVIVVGDAAARPWSELGVSAVLPEGFGRNDLMAALAEHASPNTAACHPGAGESPAEPAGWQGRLVCVTGAGGAGSSLLAMCLAQGLAADASNRGLVMLADLALDADQAMMHDSRDVIPGVQELVEACAGARLGRDVLRSMVFEPAGRGYHLLLGLRRHRHWVAIRRQGLEAALDGLTRTYRFVVADVDADAEGLPETGSADVENRNVMARMALGRADLVVAVGTGDTKGLCSLVRTIDTLTSAGVGADRLLPVINRLPRRPKRRAAAPAAMASLLESTPGAEVGDPLLVVERPSVERALRDGLAPPASLGRALAAEVRKRLPGAGPGAVPAGRGATVAEASARGTT